ncbi:MAG: hypothetical protein HY811_09555 [Planctomycetes bacterium]|nr:hypothetical protein [Planctomycetota bacterium]
METQKDIAVVIAAVTRYLEIPIEEDWVIDVMEQRDKKRGFEYSAPSWKWASDLDSRRNDKMTSWRQATFTANRLQSR